jgi:glycosyltransferase involved in cell wall biosynthesis
MGGAEFSLVDLLETMDLESYEPRLVVPSAGELSKRVAALGIPVEICPPLRRLYRSKSPIRLFAQLYYWVRGAWALRRLIQRQQPDLIHANSTASALFALGLPLRPRVPLIWHVRDLAPPGVIERWVGRLATRIVVTSEACRNAVGRFADLAKVERVPNGIEIHRGESTASSFGQLVPGEGPLVVAIGQLVPWKGYDLLLTAAELVHARNSSVRFLLIGDDRFGDHHNAADGLQQQIQRAGLEGSVCLAGFRSNVREILESADLVVHPAFPEPFGRVVVEAMAAGCPVVAFSGDHGPAEILRHEVDGLLVSPRTPEALAEAVASLVDNSELRSQMGTAGRRRAEELYDRILMTRRIESLYDSILAGAPAPIQRAIA